MPTTAQIARDALLALKPRMQLVELDELSVRLKVITAGERNDYEQWATKEMSGGSTRTDWRARFLSLSMCDDTGARLFVDDQVDQISGLPSDIVESLCDKALAINGMGGAEDESAEGN